MIRRTKQRLQTGFRHARLFAKLYNHVLKKQALTICGSALIPERWMAITQAEDAAVPVAVVKSKKQVESDKSRAPHLVV